jgi:type VII secretion protein EccB
MVWHGIGPRHCPALGREGIWLAMASRSEELRAYRFATRRLLGAVVSHRSDASSPQLRRGSGAIGAGVVIAVLSLAVFAAIGLISPKAPNWRRSDAVIVEKETGARFVYVDGVLHPVLNYASARLVVGSGDAATIVVSHADLAGAPRGSVLGIPGAPDSLPASADMYAGGWSVCMDAAGDQATVVSGATMGGSDAGDAAILALASSGTQYLIWHDHRYRIADPAVIVSVPLNGSGEPRPVPDVVVNALPPGSDLKAIPFDRGHRSTAGTQPTGTVVYTGEGADSRIYGLVRPHDIAVLTPLQKDVLVDEGAAGPVQVDQREFDGATPSIGVGADWPSDTPTFVGRDASVCVSLNAAGAVAAVRVGSTVPTGGVTAPDGGSRLVVSPGRAVLVRAGAAPGGTGAVASAPLYLVTDADERFAIADKEALASLGYADTKVVTLPSDVLDTLPNGVVLSRAAAQAVATG